MVPSDVEPAPRRGGLLVAAGILLVALNLRAAITSVGTVLGELQAGLHMSDTVAGFLATVPALCFGVCAAGTPRLARRFGAHRTLTAALFALVAGLVARVLAERTAVFLAASVLALAGIAAANVLLPTLVKAHFPTRIGALTGLYTMVLNVGSALGTALTVPAGHLLGDRWQGGLGLWAALAVLALPPWLALLRSGDPTRRPGVPAPARRRGVARTRTGWAVAVFFGAQSLQAYVVFGWLPTIFRDAGFSTGTAGLLVTLMIVVCAPFALVLPALAARGRRFWPYVLLVVGSYLASYLGLAVAPRAGAVLWAVLLGVAGASFAMALLLVGLRSRTPAGTTSLSAFAQGVGYLFAATGPLLVGFLHQHTGGWRAPLLFLSVVLVPQLVAGLVAARHRYLEDELPDHDETDEHPTEAGHARTGTGAGTGGMER